MGKIKRVTPQKESGITASVRECVPDGITRVRAGCPIAFNSDHLIPADKVINISSTNHTKMLSLLDCFAGAGGSSWGAVETRKISVKMAINHDANAIRIGISSKLSRPI